MAVRTIERGWRVFDRPAEVVAPVGGSRCGLGDVRRSRLKLRSTGTWARTSTSTLRRPRLDVASRLPEDRHTFIANRSSSRR